MYVSGAGTGMVNTVFLLEQIQEVRQEAPAGSFVAAAGNTMRGIVGRQIAMATAPATAVQVSAFALLCLYS